MPSTGNRTKEATLSALAKRHEPFREIIDRFGLVLCRQAETRDALDVPEFGPGVFDEERFLSGEPLVGGVNLDVFVPAFGQAASRIWPVMGVVFPALAESLTHLGHKMASDPTWVGLGLRAVAHGQGEALEQGANLAGVSPDFLLTALRAAWAPVIAAAKPALLALAPADLWHNAHCPVCGSDPDLATLENHPDPSEFLVSKSGEMWHHCPVCAHRWRFVRMICPGCGNQDHERLTRFSAVETPREHVYACEECRRYLPCLDLVERHENLDFDLAALGLVHLDAVAQTKGYQPLSPAPWTALGLSADQAKAS